MGQTISHAGNPTCRHHGAVKLDIDPCSVEFTFSNPGPFTITVNTAQTKKGTLSEADNCGGASGIATVTGSGSSWTATAGATTGSCTATFSFTNKRGKVVGTADLSITNSI